MVDFEKDMVLVRFGDSEALRAGFRRDLGDLRHNWAIKRLVYFLILPVPVSTPGKASMDIVCLQS